MSFLAMRTRREWSKKKKEWIQRQYFCIQENKYENGKVKSYYYGYWPVNPRKPVPNAKWVSSFEDALPLAATIKETEKCTVHIKKLKKGVAVYWYPK